MKVARALVVGLSVLAAAPVFAQEPVATVTASRSILPYAQVGDGVFVEAGVNGMPAEVSIGMIITVVDPDDSAISFVAEVTGNVTDSNQPTSQWTATLLR
jgi:hypothetical protein